ncbi:ABC transporter substrate-binding protein [Actinomarinicola tropica]|uniref:Myristoyl transferase n=1 Tax=Actinomarinicola tropica TaxID=2789776 RepID=A0A5Q2RCC7_9ACTN|nr:ABC transporter substrate-binding protein [Actinomarinicola tropica]QGG94498.1 myristoyl transferase [Actinomarinicola tropica]
MIRTWRRTAALLAAPLLLLAACGDDGDDASPGTTAGEETAPLLERVDPDRCEANRAAGTITFATGFDFGAAASILDVVAAEAEGYYDDLCLDVELQPGFSVQNLASLSAGQVQLAGVGSFSEAAKGVAEGAEITTVIVYGKTPVEQLIVEADSDITELADLTSAPMGVKGGIPYSIRAMIAAAGVDESEITQIDVDFNPVLLFETEIESLPVYKSNEPRQLDEQGYEYRVFDPSDYDVAGSFGVIAANTGFAEEHPTAVEDFVRATLRGFQFGIDDPEGAVAASLERSDPDLFFSQESELFRWETERDLVLASTPEDEPIGNMSLERLSAEVENLERLGVIEPGSVDVAAAFDNSFIEAVHDGTELVWPGE